MTSPFQDWISRPVTLATRLLTSSLMLATLFVSSARAQTYTKTILHDFTGGADGRNPAIRLIVDPAGNLYGATSLGGAYDRGIVFKIDPSGQETILHTFTDTPFGVSPAGRLVMDAAGNLYGTTQAGGYFGCGTVFKLDTSGGYSVLYNFIGGQFGCMPAGGLVLVGGGYFFGTTNLGGIPKCVLDQSNGCGIVFKLAPTSGGEWKLTVLHSFSGPTDGAHPIGELTRDSQGYLYGATAEGGAPSTDFGIVFKVRAKREIVVHRFAGGTDGADPTGGLVKDSAGNLYGTTQVGGGPKCGHGGCGTVYKIDASGNETVLYAFTGGADGRGPSDRLLIDSVGNLYGTTIAGGQKPDSGVVYRLDSSGNESVLYNFLGRKDGRFPSTIAKDAAGNFYGTTILGGLKTCANGQSCGTVFKLTPP